jgi:hypothetical protein
MPALLDEKPPCTPALVVPAGPEQGVIEEARRRQRRRRIGIALGGLIAAAGIGGIVLAGGGGGSHTAPRAAGVPGPLRAAAHTLDIRPGRFSVRLVPVLTGGEAGWCTVIDEPGGGGGGCPSVPVTTTPLFAGINGSRPNQHYVSIVTLTTPQVATVVIDRRHRVPTVALPGLPYGLRAARLVLKVTFPHVRIRRSGRRTTIPGAPPPPVEVVAPPSPAAVALDAQGHVIPEPVAVRGRVGGLAWQSPSPQPHGACSLRVAGVLAMTPEWGHVATTIKPFGGQIVGRTFQSCIDTEYRVQHSSLDVAMLLDAAHPGTLPAAIPGLEPVSGARGFFDGPGAFQGDITATRRGATWLVVAGGSGPAQRIRVLRHLSATVRL